jgi:hypothetical protein
MSQLESKPDGGPPVTALVSLGSLAGPFRLTLRLHAEGNRPEFGDKGLPLEQARRELEQAVEAVCTGPALVRVVEAEAALRYAEARYGAAATVGEHKNGHLVEGR